MKKSKCTLHLKKNPENDELTVFQHNNSPYLKLFVSISDFIALTVSQQWTDDSGIDCFSCVPTTCLCPQQTKSFLEVVDTPLPRTCAALHINDEARAAFPFLPLDG